VPLDLLALGIEEDLGRDHLDAKGLRGLEIVVYIDKQHPGPTPIGVGQGLQDRRHLLARDAAPGTQVDHGGVAGVQGPGDVGGAGGGELTPSAGSHAQHQGDPEDSRASQGLGRPSLTMRT
jgi:hypothetical protein